MAGAIVVVPYDPEWPARFAAIAATLAEALRSIPVVSIEHVGSTSVPGLAAKPVIDVDVVVRRDDLGAAIAAMERAGYRYEGDLGIPDRHAFEEPGGAIRQNTYVAIEGCLALRNHLGLREVLRGDPVLRGEYAAVKERLAGVTTDMGVYVEGKSAVLRRVLAAAGLNDEELAEVEAWNRR